MTPLPPPGGGLQLRVLPREAHLSLPPPPSCLLSCFVFKVSQSCHTVSPVLCPGLVLSPQARGLNILSNMVPSPAPPLLGLVQKACWSLCAWGPAGCPPESKQPPLGAPRAGARRGCPVLGLDCREELVERVMGLEGSSMPMLCKCHNRVENRRSFLSWSGGLDGLSGHGVVKAREGAEATLERLLRPCLVGAVH